MVKRGQSLLCLLAVMMVVFITRCDIGSLSSTKHSPAPATVVGIRMAAMRR